MHIIDAVSKSIVNISFIDIVMCTIREKLPFLIVRQLKLTNEDICLQIF